MRRQMLLSLILATIPLAIVIDTVKAQSRPPAAKGSRQERLEAAPLSSQDSESLTLERERFNFEQKKYELETALERQKLDVESTKAKWSQIATVVPLIVALLTLFYSVLSQNKQAKLQRELQKETAKLQFELQKETAKLQFELQKETAKLQFEIKAAELAFSGSTPIAVLNRAKALKAMFANRLPEDFYQFFDPKDYGGIHEPSEEKKFFVELLLKNPARKVETLHLWKALFPADEEWLSRVETLIKDDNTLGQSGHLIQQTGVSTE